MTAHVRRTWADWATVGAVALLFPITAATPSYSAPSGVGWDRPAEGSLRTYGGVVVPPGAPIPPGLIRATDATPFPPVRPPLTPPGMHSRPVPSQGPTVPPPRADAGRPGRPGPGDPGGTTRVPDLAGPLVEALAPDRAPTDGSPPRSVPLPVPTVDPFRDGFPAPGPDGDRVFRVDPALGGMLVLIGLSTLVIALAGLVALGVRRRQW